MKTQAEIGQLVRRCRLANEAMTRACRHLGRGRNVSRRFLKHWRRFWKLSEGGKLAVVAFDEIPENIFREPCY